MTQPHGRGRAYTDMSATMDAATVPAVALDAASFDAWVAPHIPAMFRVAARLTSPADADDVVQHALIRAWDKRTRYDETRGTPAAWLVAVVIDQARKTRRTTLRRALHLAVAEPGVTDARVTADTADASSRRIDIDRAIARLSTRQRVAVELYYFGGLSTDEVAHAMHVRPGTAKSTLSDARERLRDLLGAFNV
ncbi:MAG: polymerase, sigma-24 subunit, subfamily [Frankiales bacterium]|nr:polymerase, sigma-24 subunit, subfamily [Frankiales bacterium]